MPKALITGASSGIGAEIARSLSEKGFETVLVARSEDALKRLASSLKTKSEVAAADLSDIESVKKLTRDYPDIDILVNNAGFGVYGEFDKTDFDREKEMIDVNVIALHFLMKAYLPRMKEHGGKILNVASSAAFFPGPLLSSYYASKAYVLRLSNAVREELRREKVPVTISVLCPGPVETQFGKASGSNLGKKAVSARLVAEVAVSGMLAGKKTIVPTLTIKATRILSKLLPEALSVRTIYKIQAAKKK